MPRTKLGSTTQKAATTKSVASIEKVDESWRIGSYEFAIAGTSEQVFIKLARSGDIIAEAECYPTEYKAAATKATIDAIHEGRIQLAKEYSKAVPVEGGLVDYRTLVEHPLNKAIYGDEGVQDLVELLSQPDGQVFPLVVNRDRQIVSGNRCHRAVVQINQADISEGKQPRYELIEVKVENFNSLESELKYLLLRNQYRKKSPKQVASEASVLANLKEVSGKAVGEEEVTQRFQELLGGASRATAAIAKKTFRNVEGIKNENLKNELKELAIEQPHKASGIVGLAPPEGIDVDPEDFQGRVLTQVRAAPKMSVKRAAEAVSAALIQDSLQDSLKETDKDGISVQKLIDAAIAAGDKPSDNRKTPQWVIELALDSMRTIDVDCFAMIDDPGYVPAAISYTILDNCFTKQLEGNLFANPPFSKAAEAIAHLHQAICSGKVKSLFLVLPASVLSTKAYHLLLGHSPLILVPSTRLAFEPGKVLLSEQPGATADGNREPSIIVFWSQQDQTNYSSFADAASQRGEVFSRWTPFNPYILPGLFTSLKWEKKGDSLFANVFGQGVTVQTQGDRWHYGLSAADHKGLADTQQQAKWLGIMAAIAAMDANSPF